MTREEAITNLKMIRVAFVDPGTKEQRKLIDDTFEMAIQALSQEPSRKGHWIEHGHLYKCSVCGELSCCYGKFCNECGAEMER